MIAAPGVLDICGAFAARQLLVRRVGAVPTASRGEEAPARAVSGPAAAEPRAGITHRRGKFVGSSRRVSPEPLCCRAAAWEVSAGVGRKRERVSSRVLCPPPRPFKSFWMVVPLNLC